MGTPSTTAVRSSKLKLAKGSLLAARFAGRNWDIEDVGVVLDVTTLQSRELHVTIITERSIVLAMREQQLQCVFEVLPERDESIFLMTYALLSNWQVEEDAEAGRFAESFRKARALLESQRLLRRVNTP